MRKKRKRKSAIESFPFRPVRRRLLFFSIKMCYSSVLASRRLPQSTSSSPSSSLSSVTSRSRELPRRPPPLSLTYVPSNSNNTRHQNLRFLKFKEIILVSPDVVVVVVTEINRQPLPLCVSLFFLVLLAPSLLARLASSLPKGRSPPKGKQAISSPLPPPPFRLDFFLFLAVAPSRVFFFLDWVVPYGSPIWRVWHHEFDEFGSFLPLFGTCQPLPLLLEHTSATPRSWTRPLRPASPPSSSAISCRGMLPLFCRVHLSLLHGKPVDFECSSSTIVAIGCACPVCVCACACVCGWFSRLSSSTRRDWRRILPMPPPLWEPLPTITKQNVLLVGRAVQSVCRLSLSVWSWMMWSCFVQVLPRS